LIVRAQLFALAMLGSIGASARAAQQPAASVATAAAAAPAASSSASAAASALPPDHPRAAELPPGHPPTDLPPGHPPTDAPPAPAHGERTGFFKPPTDTIEVDAELPPGVVDVTILDADGRPIPRAAVTLAVLRQSVIKGESREHVGREADEAGRLRFVSLETGSGVSYRVLAQRGAGAFASDPFGLKDKNGVRVTLHAYESTTELARAGLVMEAFVLLELKQDVVAVHHLVRALNIGRTAFVADRLALPLPPDYRAFQTDESMTGIRVQDVENVGVALSGTFPPGELELTYRFHVPLGFGDERRLRVALPPRVVQTTVMVGGGGGMRLDVAGFPAAQPGRRRDGQRVIQTARRAELRSLEDFLARVEPELLDITIAGIPTPGAGRWIALALGLLAIAGGAAYLRSGGAGAGARAEARSDLEDAREALLDEIVALERAHRTGRVGPKSYERLRAAMLDALARLCARIEEAAGAADARVQARGRDGGRRAARAPAARDPRPARS
jgi:hypothetical protein